MAKGVLGNDPFQRGAAQRDGERARPEDKAEPSAKGSPSKPRAKSPGADAPRAHAQGKTSRVARAGRSKSASGPSRAATKDARTRAAKGTASPPPPKPPAPPRHATATRREKEPSEGAPPRRSATSQPPRPAASPRKAGVSSHAPTDGHGVEPAPGGMEHLREPAASTVAPNPVTTNEGTPRTERQREVDHALAEAVAAEVAETTARLAVDEALERRPGKEDAVERLLATELTTELAEAAAEEALDHSPTTERPEAERELAAAVAARVAESAAELAVSEVMDHAPRGGPPTASDERAPFSRGARRGEADVGDDAVEAETPDLEATYLEAEVEVADPTRDELPSHARRSLTLVPPTSDSDEDPTLHAPHASRAPEAARPLAERATGMLALARDIAGQALASEGIGRALGAMNGLVDAVRAGLGTGGGAHLDEYGKDPSLVRRLEPVLEFLYGQYWRVTTQCIEQVPRGAAILVANHSGALPYDGLVMSLALTRERPDLREARWLVEDQVFHAPVLGTLFNRLGAVRACPENALRLLDEHRPVVVFPEGYQALSKPFAERYRLKRFGRGGFVKLALRTGAPIVPVAIVGSEETSPMLGRLPASFLGLPFVPLTPLGPVPLPAKWSIRFGEPISMEGVPAEAADDLGEVQRLTERTREAIQGMLHALLKERRSVFAG